MKNLAKLFQEMSDAPNLLLFKLLQNNAFKEEFLKSIESNEQIPKMNSDRLKYVSRIKNVRELDEFYDKYFKTSQFKSIQNKKLSNEELIVNQLINSEEREEYELSEKLNKYLNLVYKRKK